MTCTYGEMTNREFGRAMSRASLAIVNLAILACILWEGVATERDCESQNRAADSGIVFG